MSPFDKITLLSTILAIIIVVLFCVQMSIESSSMISYINIQFPYNVALLICDDGTTILGKESAMN
jgi:Sodium:neurotransmitter symporter family